MSTYQKQNDYKFGLRRGLPIALGYLPVSFTFGIMAVQGGLPPWLAIFISMSNLTSAGQFSGTNLILANASLFEIGLTTFIINIRYMLMSLSLSQKVDQKVTLLQRLIFAFGITDETFTVASMENGKLSFSYLIGLMTGPFLGWSFGTVLGAFICNALPADLSSAMNIALYAMFIAIIIPPSKNSKSIFMIVIISIAITCILKYIPLFAFISSGFRVIIACILGASIGAYFYPIEEEATQNE